MSVTLVNAAGRASELHGEQMCGGEPVATFVAKVESSLNSSKQEDFCGNFAHKFMPLLETFDAHPVFQCDYFVGNPGYVAYRDAKLVTTALPSDSNPGTVVLDLENTTSVRIQYDGDYKLRKASKLKPHTYLKFKLSCDSDEPGWKLTPSFNLEEYVPLSLATLSETSPQGLAPEEVADIKGQLGVKQ